MVIASVIFVAFLAFETGEYVQVELFFKSYRVCAGRVILQKLSSQSDVGINRSIDQSIDR